ncbi:MAG: hypothetical protein AB1758_03585 [Candidatus Eremiobacterota bacterium]
MIVLVAPEPARWLRPLMEAWPRAFLFAPWALIGPAPAWLPGRLRLFWERRSLAGARLCCGPRGVLRPWRYAAPRIPFWPLLEGALGLWAGTRTERRMALRFFLRQACDRLAAAWLPAGATHVVAPGLAAHRTFARARARGVRTVLVEDLPDFRRLHADLEEAWERHPECGFLRRYRAGRSLLVRQETERALADGILSRGAYARSLRVESGFVPERIGPLPWPDARPLQRSAGRVLLAGLATGRSGVMEALEVLRERPGLELCVNAGEGLEPAGLLDRPGVSRWDGAGADLVLAPGWCETYPEEVAAAARAGIPVVGTARSAGFACLAEEVAPGQSLVRAVDRWLGHSFPFERAPSFDLAAWLAGLQPA